MGAWPGTRLQGAECLIETPVVLSWPGCIFARFACPRAFRTGSDIICGHAAKNSSPDSDWASVLCCVLIRVQGEILHQDMKDCIGDGTQAVEGGR